MSSPELLVPPRHTGGFSFWGDSAVLELPAGAPEVVLRYATEPPHGDPLYSLRINGILVGASGQPALFWGRDLHLSSCRSLLAVTSYSHAEAWYHVIHLAQGVAWSSKGLVKLEDVSPDQVVVRLFNRESTWAAPRSIRLAPVDTWTSVLELPNTELALSDEWPRGTD